MPIYWMNLDAASERRLNMRTMLHTYAHKRIQAVTVAEAVQKQSSIQTTDTVGFYHNTEKDLLWKKHLENQYTYKELATSLSHLKSIETAYKNGDEIALILEDDVILGPHFVEKSLQLIHVAPKGWDVLQLYVQHHKIVGHFNHVLDPWIFWQSKNWAATAYFICRKGMKKLLDKMYKGNTILFQDPVIVADEMVYASLNAYTSTYPIIKTTGESSQIQTDKHSVTLSRSQKINTVIQEKESAPIHFMPCTHESLSIVTQIDSIQHFIQDRDYIETWHNGRITWHVIGSCPSIPNLTCISNMNEITQADFVLIKSSRIRMPGFAWQTFWKKSKTATISSVLFSLPDKDLKYTRGELPIQPVDDQFFYYKLYTQAYSSDVANGLNRGAFFFVQPIKTDVVLERFAIMNGSFAAWLFGQPTMHRLEFEWCGAASRWSSKTPCQLVPIGIQQNSTLPPPPLSYGYSHNETYLNYSKPFRTAYMEKQRAKITFAKSENPFNRMKHFTMHDTYNGMMISAQDVIISSDTFMSPIVIPEYKWILFSIQKIASSTLKKFIRKITDIGCSNDGNGRPQRENDGCFTFLRDYDSVEASKMMSDPAWTKSIFLRDPYARILSAYLFMKKESWYTKTYCQGRIPRNFSYFLNEIVSKCDRGSFIDPHFALQYDRVPSQWWPYINFIGTLENFTRDFSMLIRRLGLWRQYKNDALVQKNNEKHSTNAQNKIEAYYDLETELFVKEYYAKDIELYKQIHVKNILPQVVIAGFQKCGTTSLRLALSKYAQIQMYPKEMMYFLEGPQNNTLKSWRDHIMLEQPILFDRNKGLVMAHMGSAMAGPIRTLQILQPETKLILLLRDPVERAYSAFQYFIQQENKNTWGEVWKQTKTFEDIVRTTMYKNESMKIHPCLRGGFYRRHLDHIVGFGQEITRTQQIYIDYSENVWSNNFDSQRLSRFIGVDTPNLSIGKYNSRLNKEMTMTRSQRTRLEEFYKDHLFNLCRWLRRRYLATPQKRVPCFKLTNWSSFRYHVPLHNY